MSVFVIKSRKHLESAKAELLRCAEEVDKIQRQVLRPQWQRDIDSSYYRQRIQKLEVLIGCAEVEEDVDGTRTGVATTFGS